VDGRTQPIVQFIRFLTLPLFSCTHRGLPQVCVKMRRPQKGDIGTSRDIGQHPDFYKISMFAPLPEEPGLSCTAMKKVQGIPIQQPTDQQSPNQSSISFSSDIKTVPALDVKSRRDSVDAAGEPGQNDQKHDEKPARVDDAASTVGDVSDEVARFNDSSASLSSPPRSALLETSMNDSFGIRTPVDYADGPDSFGNLRRAPSGTSLSSWNDHDDPDLMWSGGMSTTSSVASPSMSHADNCMGSFASQCFSQVTPPGRLRMVPNSSRGNGGYMHHPRQQDMMRAPYGLNSFEDSADSSGLSVADLCYLTQQNRILLSQAHRRND
jgi:hypothetical protein